MGGQRQNAGQVVALLGMLLLRKVADDVVKARPVPLAQHVEQKGVDVIVQRLVVQEQLGQQAQGLAVDLGLAAVDFKDGDRG